MANEVEQLEARVRELQTALADAAEALRQAKLNYERFTPTTSAGEVNEWIHDVDVARRAALAVGGRKP